MRNRLQAPAARSWRVIRRQKEMFPGGGLMPLAKLMSTLVDVVPAAVREVTLMGVSVPPSGNGIDGGCAIRQLRADGACKRFALRRFPIRIVGVPPAHL